MPKYVFVVLILLTLLTAPASWAQEATEAPPPAEVVATDAPTEPPPAVETEAPVITDVPTELATEPPPATDLPVVTDAPTELPVVTEAPVTEAPIEAAPTEAPVVTEAPVEATPVPTENRVIVTPEVATDTPEAAAATFVVNTTADIATPASADGICDSDIGAPIVCTLREAIVEANGTAAADVITFNIPAPQAPFVINLTSTLPAITAPVTINGASQPGYNAASPAPVIGINALAVAPNAEGLQVSASNTVIRALAIYNASGNGIEIDGNNNRVIGCWIGLDLTGADNGNANGVFVDTGTGNIVGGTTALQRNVISGQVNAGVFLRGNNNAVIGNRIGTNPAGTAAIPNLYGVLVDMDNNRVGGALAGEGNLISGNAQEGMRLGEVDQTVVQGNRIGLDVNGAALPNGNGGIQLLEADNNLIGGTAVGAGNVISGNTLYGIFMDAVSDQNRVYGNRIGTNPAGTAARPNASGGVYVRGSRNRIGAAIAGARNVISGNGQFGIMIDSPDTPLYNVVQGNFIGTNAAGNTALPNTGNGIFITAHNNLIGGTTARARNVISGNTSDGIEMVQADYNAIQGNFIGTNAAGTGAVPNFQGILFGPETEGNLVGGLRAGAGNRIAFHPGDGISVGNSNAQTTIASNTFLGNSIYNNGGLGIDLGQGGVTANDPGTDADTGPNGLQNFPVLNGALPASPTSTRITGYIDSELNSLYRIEFFANPTCDAAPNNHGEGRRYLGSTFVISGDSSLEAHFSVTLPVTVPAGAQITATATRYTLGNVRQSTSEFSRCLPYNTVLAPAPRLLAPASGATVTPSNGTITLQWSAVTGSGYVIELAFERSFRPESLYGRYSLDGGTSFPVPIFAENTLYWRMATLTPDGLGPWSRPRVMTVVGP